MYTNSKSGQIICPLFFHVHANMFGKEIVHEEINAKEV